MYGSNIMSLRIYTRTLDGGPLNQVWSKYGTQGDFWERVDTNLQVTDGTVFQVRDIELYMSNCLFYSTLLWTNL